MDRTNLPAAPEQAQPAGQEPTRRIKIRPGTLGWFLCWAVVFADLGTSVYYTPGILVPTFGVRSGIFVAMTFVVFVLLAIKYAEITWRFPEGGGVVNVSARAFHPFVGLIGGLLILVDYYLTAAISALSGVIYLGVVFPALSPQPVVEGLTVTALLAIGVLNWIGIKDSARTSALMAILAGAGQLAVVAVTAWILGWSGIQHTFHVLSGGPRLTPLFVIQGYAGAFLAFSGLETIAQLAPTMREPRRRIGYQAMGAAILIMALTSPLLTIWSTTLLTPNSGLDPNQLISILGARMGGALLGGYVAISGALLLIFASNAAVIGAYHVFVALSRMGFLPRILEKRNSWRNTPQWAILLAVLVPVTVIVVSAANV
ncbi:MAG: APC family permease, partial [Candidatus Dormibacteraceae bacterium]